MMIRTGTISYDFSLFLDTVEEADRVDIETVVDEWLDLFTSEAPWRRAYALQTVFNTPDRDTLTIAFESVLQDDAWEYWNAGLEAICLEWLSNPLNLSRLEADAATEVKQVMEALRTKATAPDDAFAAALWHELSFETQRAIGVQASEDKVRSPERAQIREDLIDLLSGLTRDYRKRMDDHVRAYEEKQVVLIEQSTKTVRARGCDLSDAAENLLLFGEPIYRLKPIPRETEGRWVYHAFHVPECLHFERRDAHLVERWGVYEGSYTIVETIAA
jgi:hypothetical protein